MYSEHLFYDEGVDNFDSFNEKYRETYDWIEGNITNKANDVEITQNTISPSEIFKSILVPKENPSEIVYDSEYKSRETNPIERINSLKVELIECEKEINSFVECFKSNNFILNKENIVDVYDEIKLYKSKLDSFIDYKVFSGKDDSNEENSRNSIKNEKNLKSLNEYNGILTNNIISRVKMIEEEIQNSGKSHSTVQYELLVSPEFEIETLTGRLTNIDIEITQLERTIGDWSLYDNGESICTTLNKLLCFVNANANEKYEKKFQTSKDCGTMISNFIEKRKDQINIGSYYIKIKDLYSILELCESFDNIFEYLKMRLVAIKSIHEQSDQFSSLISILSESIMKTEKKYKELLFAYEEVFKKFEEYEKVIEEVDLVDKMMKDKFTI